MFTEEGEIRDWAPLQEQRKTGPIGGTPSSVLALGTEEDMYAGCGLQPGALEASAIQGKEFDVSAAQGSPYPGP